MDFLSFYFPWHSTDGSITGMGSQSESSSGDYWRLADASLDFLSFKQKNLSWRVKIFLLLLRWHNNKKKQKTEQWTRKWRGGETCSLSLSTCLACRVSLSLSRVCVFYLFIYKKIEEEKGAVVMAAIDPAPLTFSCCFFVGSWRWHLNFFFPLDRKTLYRHPPVVFTYLINK